jgi:photosystem II stability/assembly factor-like uncharacterized protein
MAFALVATLEGITALDADGGAHPEWQGAFVSRLARGATGWLAIADDARVLRRSDDGTWNEIAAADANLISVYPFRDSALGGTIDGRLVQLDAHGARTLPGFDTIDGRENWHAVPSGVPYVRSLTVTADDHVVLANVHVGGIPRSTDGGHTWTPTIDPEVDVHEVRAHSSDPTVVVAAAGYGFAQSADAGATWTMTTDGLHADYCRAVAFTSDAVLVTASNGPFNAEGAIYRRAIGDTGPFEQCVDGLPHRFAGNIDTSCLDADGEDAVLVDASGAVFASGDDGFSWSHIADIEVGANSVVLA